jgi:hypothetical protein
MSPFVELFYRILKRLLHLLARIVFTPAPRIYLGEKFEDISTAG